MYIRFCIRTFLCIIIKLKFKLKTNIHVFSKQINGRCNIFDRWYCSLIENILWASNIIFRVANLLNLIYFELYTYLKLHNPHTHEIFVTWIAKKNNWVKYGYHQYDIIAVWDWILQLFHNHVNLKVIWLLQGRQIFLISKD